PKPMLPGLRMLCAASPVVASCPVNAIGWCRVLFRVGPSMTRVNASGTPRSAGGDVGVVAGGGCSGGAWVRWLFPRARRWGPLLGGVRCASRSGVLRLVGVLRPVRCVPRPAVDGDPQVGGGCVRVVGVRGLRQYAACADSEYANHGNTGDDGCAA